MNKILRPFFVAVAALSFIGCSDEPLPQAPTSHASAGTQAQLSYRMSWPPAEQGEKQGKAEPVVLVENLLARTYYLVFDASASMDEKACGGGGTKIEVAKTAAAEFVATLRDDDNVGLLVFDGSGVSERVPIGAGRVHKANVIDAIRKIRTGNGTPLHDAITRGYRQVVAQARRQLGYGTYTLVIVTDGEANPGQDPRQIVDYVASYSPVRVHTIGFCIGAEHSLNRPGITLYTEARDLESLRRGFREVLAEAPGFDVATFQR